MRNLNIGNILFKETIMKDEQRVYIKGDSERGKEVIKILEDLGGINNLYYTGMNKDAVYFINPQGGIDWTHDSNTSIILPYIKEFYKEIQLPRWKPKYKEHFYYFTSTGLISQGIWDNSPINDLYYEFGNCFKTFEEAKEASRKIEEMLNQ